MRSRMLCHAVAGLLCAWVAGSVRADAPPMVRVPAGEFVMGDWRSEGQVDERPAHVVQVKGFLIDTFEVTNQQYVEALNWAMLHDERMETFNGTVLRAFGPPVPTMVVVIPLVHSSAASSYSAITWDGDPHGTFGVVPGEENRPVVQVSWYGAAAYCNWRSAMEGRETCCDVNVEYKNAFVAGAPCDLARSGYRLPTESEWEKAAGWDAHEARPYRFGEHSDGCGVNCLDGDRANFADSGDPFDNAPYPQSTPVGFYADARSYYGGFDMSGNVWEWCYDRYSSTYYASSPGTDPKGPATGTERVERGGSWFNDPVALRTTMRNHFSAEGFNPNVGFRCVQNVTADLDGDGDFDPADLAPFAACLSGPGETSAPAGCGSYDRVRADWDSDGDVDLQDAAIFMRELGAAISP